MLTIIIVAALVALFVLFSGVYTEVLWFNQIGYSEVFWTEHITRAVLFVIGALAMGGATWAAMWLAWRGRPKNLGDRTRDTLAQYQQQLEPIRRLVFIGVPALLAFFAGSAAMSAWQDVLLFLNQVPYGKTDPEFGMDFSFYMATLPMLGILVGYLISVVLIAGIAGLLVHYLYGSIRVEERGGITVEKGARIHIGVFVALFLLLQGANYWLDPLPDPAVPVRPVGRCPVHRCACRDPHEHHPCGGRRAGRPAVRGHHCHWPLADLAGRNCGADHRCHCGRRCLPVRRAGVAGQTIRADT